MDSEIKEVTPNKPSAGKVTKVKKEEKPGRNQTIIVTVDMSFEDVLKYDKDHFNVKFSDDERAFKKLNGEELKQLSLETCSNYYVSQALLMGIDVGMIDKPYDVTPGSASNRLEVLNKDPNRVYRWESKETLARAASKGFKVDVDPNVTNYRGDTGVKYVGGQRNPELILTSARKEDVIAAKKTRKARRDLAMTRNVEEYKETIARLGSEGTVESFDK